MEAASASTAELNHLSTFSCFFCLLGSRLWLTWQFPAWLRDCSVTAATSNMQSTKYGQRTPPCQTFGKTQVFPLCAAAVFTRPSTRKTCFFFWFCFAFMLEEQPTQCRHWSCSPRKLFGLNELIHLQRLAPGHPAHRTLHLQQTVKCLLRISN